MDIVWSSRIQLNKPGGVVFSLRLVSNVFDSLNLEYLVLKTDLFAFEIWVAGRQLPWNKSGKFCVLLNFVFQVEEKTSSSTQETKTPDMPTSNPVPQSSPNIPSPSVPDGECTIISIIFKISFIFFVYRNLWNITLKNTQIDSWKKECLSFSLISMDELIQALPEALFGTDKFGREPARHSFFACVSLRRQRWRHF